MTAQGIVDLLYEQKAEDLKVAFAKLYYDGIMIDNAFMEDIKSLADEFESEREDLVNKFSLYEDNNLFIPHNTLARLLCIDKDDVRNIFNKSQISIKDLRFLFNDLQIHKVHNIFDDSELIGRITEYVDIVNDFVKVNDGKDKTHTKYIFYKAKQKWINRLISNGFLTKWHYETDDKENKYYALTFTVRGKMYYFHQPLHNINCIESDYADLEDKDRDNVYIHHDIDKESNVLVNDKILRNNLIILFKYLAYRKSI